VESLVLKMSIWIILQRVKLCKSHWCAGFFFCTTWCSCQLCVDISKILMSYLIDLISNTSMHVCLFLNHLLLYVYSFSAITKGMFHIILLLCSFVFNCKMLFNYHAFH